MTDRNERLKSIRERLSAATPGPWRMGSLSSYNAATGEPEAFVYRLDSKDERETYHNRICVRGHEDAMDCDADAEFIANAPSDIGYLLALVERYEKALETAIGALKRVDATGSWEGDFVIEAIEKCEALEAGERE